MAERSSLPVVAVVGRPNVGKSSLVNRILGRRDAIVEETPGVTRDRMSYTASWRGRDFEVVDTGGLEPGTSGLEERVSEQAQVAIETADVVVFVGDVVAGVVQDDHVIAAILRRSDRPVIVAVNKVDDPADAPAAAAWHRLGFDRVVPVTALHGTGSGDLLDAIVAVLPVEVGEEASQWGAVAIVGRPNVGKSSILNALAGEYRAIVDETPGTTRDPVASVVEIDGRSMRLVDTAGMRRQVRIEDPIEYFSWLRSRKTLRRVDAVILVVDVSEGVTAHDQRLAEHVVEEGRACVVALNKWDLLPDDEVERERKLAEVDHRFRFLDWALTIRTVAITGRGIKRVLPAASVAIAAHRTRLPTATVNRVVRDAQAERPHPRTGGKGIRILYGVQADSSPPTFVLFATGRVAPAYARYMEKKLRAAQPDGFAGSPLRLRVRLRSRRPVEV
jgi:GTP-binding protein